jgi:DNA replication protein DnaC
VSRTAIVADVLRSQARQLKMPGLTRSFEDLARQAREEHWAYEDYLHEVLAVEVASRAESAIKQRLHAAAFPEMKTLDQFDFGAAEGATPLRPAFGSAAETRSAKICAKRSTKASNGCEERLAI